MPNVSPVNSPTGVFATRRINAFRHAACCYRSGPVARNGLSLACNGCSLSEPPSQGQRSWPATSLPRRSIPLPVPSSALLPTRGLLRDRPLQRFRHVPACSTDSTCRVPGLHSPSGLLHPSGSKRSAGPAAVQPAFRFRPISVRSPLPVSITSYDCGSMFPVRYVLGGLLFLKPLGTFINMIPNRLHGQLIL